jgi:hypothetical protein
MYLTNPQYLTLGRLFEDLQVALAQAQTTLTTAKLMSRPSPTIVLRLTQKRDEIKKQAELVGFILDDQKRVEPLPVVRANFVPKLLPFPTPEEIS